MAEMRLFTSYEIEAIANVIGHQLDIFEIRRRLESVGIPVDFSADTDASWYLRETLQELQDATLDPTDALGFIECAMKPVNFIGRRNIWDQLYKDLHEALAYCGYTLRTDGGIEAGSLGTSVPAVNAPVSSRTFPVIQRGNEAPTAIQESLERFRLDHPHDIRTGFIMMHFGLTPAHDNITKAIKTVLDSHGLTAVRADEKEYHPDTLPNIQTYMHGCGFGIAVFERFESEQFNPNVGLEVGYMYALAKRVCLIKDKTLKTLQADLMGRLYRPFDPQDIETTLKSELDNWLRSYDFI